MMLEGGSIERWEDLVFRSCFQDVFSGNWRAHDPYVLERRIDAKASLYNRTGQVCVPLNTSPSILITCDDNDFIGDNLQNVSRMACTEVSSSMHRSDVHGSICTQRNST